MRRIKATCTPLILLACLYTSQPLLAGPLDRMDTGPRVNPATNDMLRVPGVVGMDYQSALATLEQAGLNPRVHMLHKQNGKYAGQEGTVVKQLPVAGGMAMLGSSVSISVFAPDNGRGAGNGMPDQGPPYDQGNGGSNMGGAGPAPGQDVPAAGGNGQGDTGIGVWLDRVCRSSGGQAHPRRRQRAGGHEATVNRSSSHSRLRAHATRDRMRQRSCGPAAVCGSRSAQ